MKSWISKPINPYYFGIISGFILFSGLPYLIHGAENGVMPFLLIALAVFIVSAKIVTREKLFVQPQEKLGRLKSAEKVFLALCIIVVAVYSVELYGQYHLNRLTAGMAVVLLLYLPRININLRLILLILIIFYVIRIAGEYSRVYLGVYLSVAIGLFLHFVGNQPQRRWNFDKGLKLLLTTIILLLLPAGILLVIGFRGEDLSTSFSVGLAVLQEGLGFDVNSNTAYILKYYQTHEFDWFHSFISLIANPIPRAFWDDKPSTFGAVLSGYYFDVEVDEVFTTLGPGLFGEFYANGGYIVMIINIVIISVLFNKSWSFIKISCSGYETSLIFWMLASLSAFLYRGDFLNGMINIILRLAPIYAYIYIKKLK